MIFLAKRNTFDEICPSWAFTSYRTDLKTITYCISCSCEKLPISYRTTPQTSFVINQPSTPKKLKRKSISLKNNTIQETPLPKDKIIGTLSASTRSGGINEEESFAAVAKKLKSCLLQPRLYLLHKNVLRLHWILFPKFLGRSQKEEFGLMT